MQLASNPADQATPISQPATQGLLTKHLDIVLAFTLFVGSFTLYIRTLAPSLLYGDSAEFQTIAYTLGIGHPTGYPVYILLAKLFTWIPIGEVAYRVNLFSAFCAASTVALVYLASRQLRVMHLPAIYGSLALTLVPLFWKYASMAEIYAPSAACLAFILFAVLRWREVNHPRWLFAAGLVGGTSLGIHTTVALASPAILIYLALQDSFFFPHSTKNAKSERNVLLPTLFGTALGIFLFLASFLFLDTLNAPAGYYNTVVHPSFSIWGMTPADFDSPFERLAFLYFPPQFNGQFFAVSSAEIMVRLSEFAADASWNLWLALLGLISLLMPRKETASCWREAVLLIVAFITFLIFALTYNVYDYYVYYIPAIVILAMLVALGVSAIVELIGILPKIPRFMPVALSIVILALGFYPAVDEVSSRWSGRVPPGLEDWETYFFTFPGNRKMEAEQTVNLLEDNAIVFTDWDNAYSYYYVGHVLQARRGMSFHETFPQEGVTQFADSAVDYIEANIDTRPIYFSERPSFLASEFKIRRTGSGLFLIERK